MVFLEAGGGVNAPAGGPPIEGHRAPEPTRRTNVSAAVEGLTRSPRRTLTRLKHSTQSRPPEAAAHQFAGTLLYPSLQAAVQFRNFRV